MNTESAPDETINNTVHLKPSSLTGQPASSLSGTPRIAPRMLRILQALWVIIALLAFYGFYAQEALRFTELDLVASDISAAQNAGLPPLTPVYILVGIDTALMIVFVGVAFVLFWRRGNDWVALETGLMLILTAFLYTGLRYRHVDGTMLMIIFLNAAAETLQVTFLYIFPNGRVLPGWWRYAVGFFFAFRFLIWASQLPHDLPQEVWEIAIVVAFLIIGFVYQVHRYRHLATPIQRQQQKWLLVGVAVILTIVVPLVFVIGIFRWVTPQSNFTLYTLIIVPRQMTLAILPLALGFSILRYRLWDIDLTIHRSIVSVCVVGILGALFGVAFIVIEGLLHSLFHSSSEIALVLSGIGIGLSFNPTRKRVQNFVDRRFYRFRFNLLELQRANQAVIHNPSAQPGEKIGGYAITSVIGKGGMGEVYRGQSSQHVAAIKMLSREALGNDLMRRRLEREADALRKLDHPNIVKFYAANFDVQQPFIALEFIDGIDLAGYLKQNRTLSLPETTRIVQKLASALEFCHTQGLVHRDLKPSNVMLRMVGGGQTYEPVLTDFGLAKLTSASTNLTGTGAIGTINYMAPEQIQDAHEVDHRADIYALGAVVYEMLCGQCVFLGTAPQVLFAHISKPAPDPRVLLPDLPPRIAQALARALAKDPEERFQNVNEFAAYFVLA